MYLIYVCDHWAIERAKTIECSRHGLIARRTPAWKMYVDSKCVHRSASTKRAIDDHRASRFYRLAPHAVSS